MKVIHFFIAPHRVHVSIQSFAQRKLVLVKSHTFPFCERVDNLRRPVCLLYRELDRALHAVKVVIQPRLRLDKKRRGNALQVKSARQIILERTLNNADSGLSIIHR